MSSKVKPILSKDETFDLDYVKFILLASASSARFGYIHLTEKNQVYPIRGNINALLVSPFGTGKTSQCMNVNNVRVVKANDLTFPGLVGTISKDGQLVTGSCMKAGGKLLIIDEAQKVSPNVKNAMNSILEPPHTYVRTLGYKIQQYVKKNGKYCKVKGSENTFSVYSKFSCIASTMYLKYSRFSTTRAVEKAWASRFMSIRMKITDDYIFKILAGETYFDVNALTYEGDFTFEEYIEFLAYYRELYEKSPFKEVFKNNPEDIGYITRNVGDMVRLSAFYTASKGDNVITLNDAKKVLNKFYRLSMHNFLVSPLTSAEYTIINNMDKTQDEIALLLGMTQSAVSYIIKGLVRKGLVLSNEEDYTTKIKY